MRGVLAVAMIIGMVSLVLFATVARNHNVGQELTIQLELALFAGWVLLLVTEKGENK